MLIPVIRCIHDRTREPCANALDDRSPVRLLVTRNYELAAHAQRVCFRLTCHLGSRVDHGLVAREPGVPLSAREVPADHPAPSVRGLRICQLGVSVDQGADHRLDTKLVCRVDCGSESNVAGRVWPAIDRPRSVDVLLVQQVRKRYVVRVRLFLDGRKLVDCVSGVVRVGGNGVAGAPVAVKEIEAIHPCWHREVIALQARQAATTFAGFDSVRRRIHRPVRCLSAAAAERHLALRFPHQACVDTLA